MAAILKLRRGTSIPSLVESELFFNQTNKTLVYGDGSTNYTLVKIGLNTGSLSLTGDITATNLTLSGNATIQGNITFGGSLITLGDSNTDNINFIGELSSSLIPNNPSAFDLGSSEKPYKSVYADSASFQNVSLSGTGILSSSLQDFTTYSSSIESQLDSIYTFTQSADQRLTSIEGFTQSVDLRVDKLEASQSYFDNTFSGSVDLRLDNLEITGSDHETRIIDLELTGSDHELRIDEIETTFSSSVDLRLTNTEFTGSDHETRITSIEGYSASLDSRLDNLEETGSNHELRIDNLELSQSYFDDIFSGSVDLRLTNAEFTGSDHENRLDEIETVFSSSVDSRLDLLENFSSSEYQIDSSSFDSRVTNLELTGSDHENRLDEIETTFSSSVDSRLDLLENFSSSEYQIDSSSFDDRISSLTNVTGSYATTGSNTFIGNQIITGSLLLSGSQFSAENLQWPSIGTETHLFKTQPFTISHPFNGTRNYDYLGIALEQILTGSWYENSLLMYSYDNHSNPTYGSELLVSPTRLHMQVLASGSGEIGKILVEEIENGNTFISLQSKQLYIGNLYPSEITIGNDNSTTRIYGDIVKVFSPISSSTDMTASAFFGDGFNLTNLQYTNVVFDGSGILSSSFQDFDTYSSSIEDQLDLIYIFTSSAEQRLSNIHSYTSSLKNAIEVSGQNLTVFGDLVVEGTTTTINTQELLIEDKLLAIASGSTTSTDADGGGFFISGANASILWNHLNQTLDFNTKVSSSVGFKGDGSELTNIPYNEIIFDGSGIVSSSIQIDLTQTTNYISGIKQRLNSENVFSSSEQVNADLITNFDSNVKDKLNSDLVHSGSYLGTATTSNLTEGNQLYYTDARVKTKLNVEGVISGSTQITDGSGIVSSSQQISDYNVFLEIKGDNVVSGSSQIDVNETQNFQTFSSSVDSRLDLLENFSSSEYQIDSSSFDSRVTNLELTGSDHENRLDEIETTFSSSVDSRLDLLENFSSSEYQIDSSSFDLRFNLLENSQSYFDGTFSSSVDSRLDNLELSGSNHEIRIDNLENSQSYFDNVYSSSVNSRLDLLENFSSSEYQIDSSSFDLRLDNLELTGSDHETRLDEIETTFSSSVDSRLDSLEVDQHTHINKLNLDSINQDLSTSDKVTFKNINLPNLSSLPISTEFRVLLYSQSGEITYSELGTAAYYHVSQSIGFEDDNVIGTAGAMKRYIDDQFLIIGAGDITEVNAGDGLSGGALSGSATLTLDTSSQYFTDGVVSSLPNGIISGSTFTTFSSSVDTRLVDLENFSSSLDDDFVTQLELASATGSLINSIAIKLDTGSYNTDSQSFDLRLDNQESFSSSIDNTIKTKLNLDGIISGSSQVEFNNINGNPFESASVQGFQVLWLNETLQYILPSSGSYTSLGAPGAPFKDLFLAGNTIDLGGTLISRDSLTGNILFIDSGSGTPVSADVNFDTIVNKPTLISGSDQLTGSLVDLISDQTISGTKTFNNIVVSGTGSFSYIVSTTGSAKIIGDAYIILNNDTPTERYAGLKVLDSGSLGTTASLEYDGQSNDWFYQYTDNGGITDDFGVVLFGPEYSSKGIPTYPTNNTIQKGNGGHHLLDSNITDNGSIITLGSNVQVNGNISITGTVDSVDVALLKSDFDTLKGKTLVSSSAQISGYNTFLEIDGDGVISGSSQISMGGDLSGTANNAQIVAGAITNTEVNATAGIVYTKLNLGGSGIVSGSSQTTLGGDVTGAANANTVGKIQGVSITSGEATQLANIDTTTISATQWGYLGALNQGLTTTSTVQFGKVGIGGASDVTYELKVTGDIGATGDVVAYISSDRRLKDEITPIPNSLQKINSIGGYSFVWNEKQDIYTGKDYGVIAQEIENILPELVETRENGYKAVKYDRIVSLLIEGIKELSKEVSELKEKIGK